VGVAPKRRPVSEQKAGMISQSRSSSFRLSPLILELTPGAAMRCRWSADTGLRESHGHTTRPARDWAAIVRDGDSRSPYHGSCWGGRRARPLAMLPREFWTTWESNVASSGAGPAERLQSPHAVRGCIGGRSGSNMVNINGDHARERGIFLEGGPDQPEGGGDVRKASKIGAKTAAGPT